MKAFMDEDFLLETPTAVELYHEFAKPQPIIDYHCHLSPEQIADNHRFETLTEIWLGGDHYKWRAMRTNGVAERLITGDASDWEKFRGLGGDRAAHAQKPALSLDSPRAQVPVRHSATGCSGPTPRARSTSTATGSLAETSSRRRACSRQYRVLVVCSTDDPVDSLEPHRRHARDPGRFTKLVPDLAARQGAAAPRSAGLESVGGPAVGRGRRRDRRSCTASWRRSASATTSSTQPAAALPTTASSGCMRATTARQEFESIFAKARAQKPLDGRGDRKTPLGPAPRVCADGSRARLGAAVSPGRFAQQQHARACARSVRTRATTRSATFRRRERSCASSIGSTSRTSWRKPCSTT